MRINCSWEDRYGKWVTEGTIRRKRCSSRRYSRQILGMEFYIIPNLLLLAQASKKQFIEASSKAGLGTRIQRHFFVRIIIV